MAKRTILCIVCCLYLRLAGGYLALEDPNGYTAIFPYRAEIYTERDQTLLQDGIPIENRAELSKVLEDYFS